MKEREKDRGGRESYYILFGCLLFRTRQKKVETCTVSPLSGTAQDNLEHKDHGRLATMTIGQRTNQEGEAIRGFNKCVAGMCQSYNARAQHKDANIVQTGARAELETLSHLR